MIKKIIVGIIFMFVISLGLWYLYDVRYQMRATLNKSIENTELALELIEEQQTTMDVLMELIEIQQYAIYSAVEEIEILREELADYRARYIESTAEVERLIQENEELKKNIAVLHAKRAQRISANGASITESDKVLMAQLIYSEARGESNMGQQAVVDVVLNRLADSRFPDTVRGVIMQAGQFDEAHILHTYPVTEALLSVVNDALNGTDVTNGALFFFNPSTAGCAWQWSRTLTAQIGQHRFSR